MTGKKNEGRKINDSVRKREIPEQIKEIALWGAKWAIEKSLVGLKYLKGMLKVMFRHMQHVLLFPIIFLYFEILLRVIGGTGIFKGFLSMLFLTVGAGLFFGGLTSMFSKKVNKVISIIVLAGTGILYIVQCLIMESFQMYMTLGDIKTGAGGVVGGFSGELFRTIFSGIPVILFFLLPSILYMLFGAKRFPARRVNTPYVILIFSLTFVISGLGILGASHGKYKEEYKSQFKFDTASRTFGLLTGVRLDLKYSLLGNDEANQLVTVNENITKKKEKKAKEEEKEYGENVSKIDFAALSESEKDETLKSMNTYVNSLTPTSKNKYTGLFKGKNLILICAEAFSDSVIHKELTPTLYRLTHKGINFSDFYQPAWGGSTSTGEYSFLTGLVPMDGVETIQKTREKLNYYTLGTQLMKQDYYSFAYHNGSYDYYDRQLTHKNLGYADWLGQGNGLEDITGAWVGDSVLFDKTMDTYIDKQPFSIYYMTVSGHAPYKSDNVKTKENIEQVKKVLGDKYEETTLNYFCYQLELEKALKIMVEKLEESGIADDTVICMTSDHYPYGLAVSKTYGNTKDYLTDLYDHSMDTDWDRDHNTWLLWSGCLEHEQKEYACEISEPTYSLDIVPTLLNLFGIEYDSRLLVGRDVFSDATPLVLWNNRSWITDKGRYDARTKEFTPNKGIKVDDSYVENMKKIVSNKITFSDQILENDYYRVLFEK